MDWLAEKLGVRMCGFKSFASGRKNVVASENREASLPETLRQAACTTEQVYQSQPWQHEKTSPREQNMNILPSLRLRCKPLIEIEPNFPKSLCQRTIGSFQQA
ncbi:MAG: hypothetical protein R3D89_12525 [Sphingomonadaceae bacterium]